MQRGEEGEITWLPPGSKRVHGTKLHFSSQAGFFLFLSLFFFFKVMLEPLLLLRVVKPGVKLKTNSNLEIAVILEI